jgi:hypothetical protein
MALFPSDAQQMLPTYQYQDVQRQFRQRHEDEVNAIYLSHLCARGDVSAVHTFLNTIQNKARVLNMRSNTMYGGTVLHTALYWNHNHNGTALYRLLTDNGAVGVADEYGEYPWTMGGITYIDMISDHVLGQRDNEHFRSLRHEICVNRLNRGLFV